jgi:4-hydroxybenzoate polyprenyltransferase
MRPHQWIKNLLVFAALLFTGQFTNPTLVWQTVLGFVALCLTASSIYLVNDILDRERDRHHPKKQHRPIASGRLPVPVAWLGAFVSLLAGLGLAFWLRVPVRRDCAGLCRAKHAVYLLPQAYPAARCGDYRAGLFATGGVRRGADCSRLFRRG